MNATGERTILADCCEDWIIEWGGFYRPGREFQCPECGTEWKKTEADGYLRGDGRSFVRRARSGPNAEFPYLAAADGHEPNVERCCAKILLAHGERMAEGFLIKSNGEFVMRPRNECQSQALRGVFNPIRISKE